MSQGFGIDLDRTAISIREDGGDLIGRRTRESLSREDDKWTMVVSAISGPIRRGISLKIPA
jgi:hypothetical protein